MARDTSLVPFAVFIDRTPPQSWPGYGIYLGNGYVITAAHVVGNPEKTNPRVVIAGKVLPARVTREGRFDEDDLTILHFDSGQLSESQRRLHIVLCAQLPPLGSPVVTVTPDQVALSTLVKPKQLSDVVLSQYPTLIGDVASTGNSGSGVFEQGSHCLLGIVSRKITLLGTVLQNGHRQEESVDIAKYFVPFSRIKAAIPSDVKY